MKIIKMKHAVIMMIGILVGASSASAVDHYVSLNGTNDSPFTTWTGAATNIQWALDVAVNGETVWVSNGTYYLTNYLNHTSGATLKSFNGRDVTIIDGNGPALSNTYIYVYGEGAVTSVLQNFTVQNFWPATNNRSPIYSPNRGLISGCLVVSNRAQNNVAGGVYLLGTSVLSNSVVINNVATNTPGGILADGGFVFDCVISNNQALSQHSTAGVGAGGIHAKNDALVERCVISDNISTNTSGSGSAGGGMTLYRAKARNCLIYNNKEGNRAGGVFLQERAWLQNCTVVSNWSYGEPAGGGIYPQGGNLIQNCIIWSNAWRLGVSDYLGGADIIETNEYNCSTVELTTGVNTGNITNHPLFADWASKNFRVAKDSPCNNRGTNQAWMTDAIDLEGHRRIDKFSGQADIGCYEYLPSGTMFNIR